MANTVVPAVIFLIVGWTGLSYSQLECKVPDALKEEIQGYQPVVDQIVKAIYGGEYSGKLFEDLADFLDTYGPRLAGSKNLEVAIDGVITRQKAAGLETSTQDVSVPQWERGEESAEILTPRKLKLSILGLGSTSATPPEGITAEVIVVKDYDELQQRKNEIPGKIVLYNAPYVSYGVSGVFRNTGPFEASKLGAVAVLVRSVTPFSLNSPHTGNTHFDDEAFRIPAAAITVEAANLIQRFIKRGKSVTVNLKMQATNLPESISRNVIADIKGSCTPDEYVVISGHIDSWDVGQGALDDGAASFLAWHSLALIKQLGLKTPRRTLRSILWTAEETGLAGANAYRKEREAEAKNWTVAFESDNGLFQSIGLDFYGSNEAACIMQEIASLLGTVNGTKIVKQDSLIGSDINIFNDLGVPLAQPSNVPNNYFWYHHSAGDTVEAVKTEDLDQNLAINTAAIYILADLSVPLPREDGRNAGYVAKECPSSAQANSPFNMLVFAILILTFGKNIFV